MDSYSGCRMRKTKVEEAMNIKNKFNLLCVILLMVSLLAISTAVQSCNGRQDTKLKTKISGTIEGEYYVSPGRIFKVKIPVLGEFGGHVEDKGNEKETIFVLLDDYFHFYTILSIPTAKSCESNLAIARTKEDFQGQETVITSRGSELWTFHFMKEGSPRSYRERQRDGTWGKPKRDNAYITRTCFRVGNRVYLLSAGLINKEGTVHYNNKEKSFALSKEQLEKFLEGFLCLSEN